jgi:predicted Zn-dependent protease
MTRDRLQQNRPAEARLLLQIALDVHPEAFGVWYDLARAEALGGSQEAALAALHEAVTRGFTDWARLQADPDLTSLRTTAEYDSVIARLRKLASARPDST